MAKRPTFSAGLALDIAVGVMNTYSLQGDPTKAGRAIGAMFFSAFGGIWLGLWAKSEYADSFLALLVVVSMTAMLFTAALRVYKRNSVARKAVAHTPESRRKSRLFNLVNVGQWAAIFVVAIALSRTGHEKWILPSVVFIVGLHFFPLARLFTYRPHYVTGAALILLAVVYPLLARDGPDSAVGALGTGLILWLSAICAISGSPPQRDARGA